MRIAECGKKSQSAINNPKSEIGDGDVAQRESTCLARRGSAVQIRSSPPRRGWGVELLSVEIRTSENFRFQIVDFRLNGFKEIGYSI